MTGWWGPRLRVLKTRKANYARLWEGPHGWSSNRWRCVQGQFKLTSEELQILESHGATRYPCREQNQ